MAASGQNPFSCAMCLDTWRDPVTIPCGHNYCMRCISACWDKEDEKGVYSCPLCSQSFSPRPPLSKNTVLAELVGNMKVQIVTSVPSVVCYAEPGDVACDFCTGRKLKADQSCLVCLASMCETHLQPHLDVPALRKHKLVKARAGLQDRLCAKHDKPLEVFCCTDQTCICMLCTMDDHKGHETTSVAAERTHKQNQVMETRSNFQQNLQETETTLQKLRETMAHHKVRELISAQQKQAGLNAEEMVQELEQRSTELKRGDAELAELCHEEDHVWFVQRFHTFKNSPALKASPIMILDVSKYFEDLRQSLSALRQTVEKACDVDMVKISAKVKETEIVRQLPAREDLLKYSCWLSLDGNTAYRDLILSELNTKVMATEHRRGIGGGGFSFGTPSSSLFVGAPAPAPAPAAGLFGLSSQASTGRSQPFYDRQVLCVQGLSGQSYWEVTRSNAKGVAIAVAYRDICSTSRFGYDDKSWSLSCSSEGCSFWHHGNKTDVIGLIPGNRIGVHLDHKEGTLSFYDVSGMITFLHRVCTKFTEPLYPGFWLEEGACLKIMNEGVNPNDLFGSPPHSVFGQAHGLGF
ncbi:tripartite motif-containing protein 16-like isoform X2 [Engraulis encrasicolus]|uniref:tripartite motif-containing protein 16-like isoform X2 n=1 Tax=Engraulis encrasicolus TaxID=184585 RepID=UPI002FD0CBA5